MRLLVLCQWPLLLFVHNDCFGQTDANRLTYLDGCDPYDVHRNFPKLIARQWVGKPGVEAVVTLSIDDMMRPGPVPSPQSGVSMRKRFLTPLFEAVVTLAIDDVMRPGTVLSPQSGVSMRGGS